MLTEMPVLKLRVFQLLVASWPNSLQNDLTYTGGKLQIKSTREAELQDEFEMKIFSGIKVHVLACLCIILPACDMYVC